MQTKGFYKTRQRDIILKLLKNNTDKHLSCEEIAELLKAGGNKVGITTVYRYLEKLNLEGSVQKYTSDKERARYTYVEKDCRGHFHLKCTRCGDTFCADCDFLGTLSEHIGKEHGFKVLPSKTVFYGVCTSCLEKDAEPKEV